MVAALVARAAGQCLRRGRPRQRHLRPHPRQRRRQHWGEEPRALLTHIAKGLVIDHWRRAEVERAYLEALAHRPEAEAPSPETRLLVLQTLQRVDALLRAMPARTREIFLLAQLDGLGYAAIAAQLRTSEVTVKRHMRKAFVACLAAA